jgi:hypothetical protein
LAAFLALAGAVSATDAKADGRTQFLIDRMKAEDFRVRTNAALQLGSTGDVGAVQPLCGGLDDSSDVVRSASAVALKRLAKSEALPCLKKHKDTERSDDVKLQIARAIEGLEGGGGGGGGDDAPKFVSTAKFYVSVSAITNNTGRPQSDVERVVASAIKAKLNASPDYQLAPKQESQEAARGVISKRKFKNAYYLGIKVEPFDYSGGNLRVRVSISIQSYPGRDLRGEVPVGLTQTGVRPGDKGAEDNLMNMAATKCVEQFAQFFQ